MKGRLVVATPQMGDPHFDRSVVYLLEHVDDGALGVIINRPTHETLAEPIDRWEDHLSAPPTVFEGGPVERSAIIGLARRETVESIDLSADPALESAGSDGVRIFRGYAGWGPGQLESEIDAGAWIVIDAIPDDVFSPQPDDLWRSILRRQPGRLAWLANAPDDLSLN